jgi:hypothetical protein
MRSASMKVAGVVINQSGIDEKAAALWQWPAVKQSRPALRHGAEERSTTIPEVGRRD